MIDSSRYRYERLISRVSLAVRLIDDFTLSSEIMGPVQVGLKNQKTKAIKNNSGYYLFLNLKDSIAEIVVEADRYFAAEQKVGPFKTPQEQLNPVITMILKPKVNYYFPADATLIRMVLKEQDGERLLANQAFQVEALDHQGQILREVMVKARLAGDVTANVSKVYLERVRGALPVGEELVFQNPETGLEETAQVKAIDGHASGVWEIQLAQGLRYGYRKNSPLFKPGRLETHTDEQGQAAVYFRPLEIPPLEKREFQVRIRADGMKAQATVSGGKATVLGEVWLKPPS